MKKILHQFKLIPWHNKNIFRINLVIVLFVIVFPFNHIWIGWILSGVFGFLTGYFLMRWMLEQKYFKK